eukprot:753185-Prymnesium_polylepis.1
MEARSTVAVALVASINTTVARAEMSALLAFPDLRGLCRVTPVAVVDGERPERCVAGAVHSLYNSARCAVSRRLVGVQSIEALGAEGAAPGTAGVWGWPGGSLGVHAN